MEWEGDLAAPHCEFHSPTAEAMGHPIEGASPSIRRRVASVRMADATMGVLLQREGGREKGGAAQAVQRQVGGPSKGGPARRDASVTNVVRRCYSSLQSKAELASVRLARSGRTKSSLPQVTLIGRCPSHRKGYQPTASHI